MAVSKRPESLRTKRNAASVVSSSRPPLNHNQVWMPKSKLSNPDSPLLDPVKLPPEKMIWVATIGNTSDTTDAYSGVAPG